MTRSGQWYNDVDHEVQSLRERVAQLESQIAQMVAPQRQSMLGGGEQGYQAPAGPGVPVAPQSPVAPQASLVPQISDEVMRHIQSGKKIAAIKQYREETGCSLREAKDFIDGHC